MAVAMVKQNLVPPAVLRKHPFRNMLVRQQVKRKSFTSIWSKRNCFPATSSS